jgi:hypothetical protein
MHTEDSGSMPTIARSGRRETKMKRIARKLGACASALLLCSAAPALAEDRSTDAPPSEVAPDNTGKNVRDRDGAMPTPIDQSDDPQDLAVTREIRRSLTADDSLGTNARNAKVITNAGVVTLRGPVADAREKAAVEAIARRAPGVKEVHNQLEVASADRDPAQP